MNDITPKEAIANLNHIYGFVAPDIQRSLDVAIKALERPQDKHDRQEGEWVRVASGDLIDDYRCNKCNHFPPKKRVNVSWGWDFTNFCPHCGADMRGGLKAE